LAACQTPPFERAPSAACSTFDIADGRRPSNCAHVLLRNPPKLAQKKKKKKKTSQIESNHSLMKHESKKPTNANVQEKKITV
jgi:hypothetical protein